MSNIIDSFLEEWLPTFSKNAKYQTFQVDGENYCLLKMEHETSYGQKYYTFQLVLQKTLQVTGEPTTRSEHSLRLGSVPPSASASEEIIRAKVDEIKNPEFVRALTKQYLEKYCS
jgi:hypothetical protein